MELFSKYVNYKKIAFPTFLQYIEKISSTKEIKNQKEKENLINCLNIKLIKEKKTILSIAESFCNKQDFKQHLSIQLLNCFLK